MAKLPETLIEPRKRKLEDLHPCERALFPLYGLMIDEEYNAFASLRTELPPLVEDNREYGEIWRDEHGKYHVDLKDTKHKWKPKDLTIFTMDSTPRMVSIETITWARIDGSESGEPES
jgi:hypothetical protein